MSKKLTVQEYLGEVFYDPSGQQIHSKDGKANLVADLPMVLGVRGWGAIQQEFDNLENAAAFQDKVGQFIVDAINEKIEAQKENL